MDVPTRKWVLPALIGVVVIAVGIGAYAFLASTSGEQVASDHSRPDSVVPRHDTEVSVTAAAQQQDARRTSPVDGSHVAHPPIHLATAAQRVSPAPGRDEEPRRLKPAAQPTATTAGTTNPQPTATTAGTTNPQQDTLSEVASHEHDPEATDTKESPRSPNAGQATVKKDAAVQVQRQDAASAKPASPTEAGDALTRNDIKAGIQTVRHHVQHCFESFKTPGVFAVQITIDPSGRVIKARVHRSVADLPVSNCIQAAVTLARFRPFEGKPITVVYPFQYR